MSLIRVRLHTLLFILLLSNIAWCAEHRGERSLHPIWLHYSGGLRGELEPCGCKIPVGGVIRRLGETERVTQLFPNDQHIILDAGEWRNLSGGDAVNDSSKALAIALSEAGCKAINLSARDVYDGTKVVIELLSKQRIPFVSSNLRFSDSARFDIPQYRIAKPDHHSNETIIGILGTTDPKYLTTKHRESGITTVSWEVLSDYCKILIEQQCGFIVLLTDASPTRIDSLLPSGLPIDLIISSSSFGKYHTVQNCKGYSLVTTFPQGKQWEAIFVDSTHSSALNYNGRELSPKVIESISARKRVDSILHEKRIRRTSP